MTRLSIDGLRLRLEMAARSFRAPPLGEDPQITQHRLNQAALALAKELEHRDAKMRGNK